MPINDLLVYPRISRQANLTFLRKRTAILDHRLLLIPEGLYLSRKPFTGLIQVIWCLEVTIGDKVINPRVEIDFCQHGLQRVLSLYGFRLSLGQHGLEFFKSHGISL